MQLCFCLRAPANALVWLQMLDLELHVVIPSNKYVRLGGVTSLSFPDEPHDFAVFFLRFVFEETIITLET